MTAHQEACTTDVPPGSSGGSKSESGGPHGARENPLLCRPVSSVFLRRRPTRSTHTDPLPRAVPSRGPPCGGSPKLPPNTDVPAFGSSVNFEEMQTRRSMEHLNIMLVFTDFLSPCSFFHFLGNFFHFQCNASILLLFLPTSLFRGSEVSSEELPFYGLISL